MHQHPRHSPVTASPASSPRTNPARTNNPPREQSSNTPTRALADMSGYSEPDDGSGDSGVMQATGPSRDAVKKLDQIIQNFHTKAAILILQSRMPLPVIIMKDGTKKVNKWFQIETDDTTSFRNELFVWKNCGGYQSRPPPLIVETYIDISSLTSNQSLVIVDDNNGKRWDVLEALNNSSGSNDGSSRNRNTQVILERWRIEMKDVAGETINDFGTTLPTVYKKCIVFFRSLYSTAKMVPAWRFVKTLSKNGSTNNALRVNCRILSGGVAPSRFDALTHPLYENGNEVTKKVFLGNTDTPVGLISADVTYRNDCNFRIDDSESILSSRFMGVDEDFFRPSLGAKGDDRRRASKTEVGSLPAHRHRSETSRPEPVQTYGSLSTFHGDVRDIPPRGSSPISALRAMKTFGSETSSPPTNSVPRSRLIQSSRVLDSDGLVRRPSSSFQPFKAGSLSSSPGHGHGHPSPSDMSIPQPPLSLPRVSGISALTQARNRSSLTAGMPATLRGGPAPVTIEPVATSSASSSPRPTPVHKYSSSFGHRRGRSSIGGGASRILTDDEQGSCGRQSISSSVQPGSGMLAEAGGASSGSIQTDDDNLSDFLKLLDSKKTLASFDKGNKAVADRTRQRLSQFQSMRESNNAFTDSMASSAMLHRSSSSSSRQLSSVPPMAAANSMSISSSPGKPISPHTPHTPAIPSRLSSNSIAEYDQPRRSAYRNRSITEVPLNVHGHDQTDGTNAIDIPTSPRLFNYSHVRRSSSVAQQHRAAEDDLGEPLFGPHRSVSLGADDREPPSISALLGFGLVADPAASPSPISPSQLQPVPRMNENVAPADHGLSLDGAGSYPSSTSRGQSTGSMNPGYRGGRLMARPSGRGVTPPQAYSNSNSSLIERAGGSGTSERGGGGRNSFTKPAGQYDTDDDNLLFQMSEIGRDSSRRSIEEPRGGGSGSVSDRGAYEGPRGGDTRSSSHRATRRGWPEQ